MFNASAHRTVIYSYTYYLCLGEVVFTYYLSLGEGGVYLLFMFRGGVFTYYLCLEEGVFTYYLCLGEGGVYVLNNSPSI